MGYFDGLADAAFKKDASGNNLFYPWGVWGAGFIIDSEDKKNQIRGFYKKMYMVMLPAIIIIHIVMGVWLKLVLLPVFCIWYYFIAKKITKDLQKTKKKKKLKVSESCKNSAKSHNLPTLIFLELISIGFVAIGVWMLQSGEDSLIAYASILFFGLGSVALGYMVVAKIKNK